MRVAIVHDYIKEYGGAERVLEALLEIYPEADVYTSVYLPKYLGPHRQRFRNFKFKTSFLQYLPFKAKLISPFRVISPFVFSKFDLSNYDIVIVSQTGAYFSNTIRTKRNNVIARSEERAMWQSYIKQEIASPLRGLAMTHGEGALHVCYTHTPPRYLYGYKTAREWKSNVIMRVFGEISNHFLRIVDFNASQNVDYFITNSNEVKARIRKFYRRESEVIYPPVEILNHKSKIINHKSDYYLTGGRLARAKGTDIIVEAFSNFDRELLIFGKDFAGFETQLKSKVKNQKSKIRFLGEVSDEEKFELMKNAKAFVFASFDEDFGITPVEAQGCGTPVIAYKSGGVKETIIDGKTGVFYEKNTPKELVEAVEKFEKMKFDPKDCIQQATNFSKERFKKEIEKFIFDKLADRS